MLNIIAYIHIYTSFMFTNTWFTHGKIDTFHPGFYFGHLSFAVFDPFLNHSHIPRSLHCTEIDSWAADIISWATETHKDYASAVYPPSMTAQIWPADKGAVRSGVLARWNKRLGGATLPRWPPPQRTRIYVPDQPIIVFVLLVICYFEERDVPSFFFPCFVVVYKSQGFEGWKLRCSLVFMWFRERFCGFLCF